MIDSVDFFWLDENESWSDQIQNAAEQYHNQSNFYPNLYFASAKTYEYINQQAYLDPNKISLEDEDGLIYDVSDMEEAPNRLTHLDFNDFTLQLIHDESIPFMAYQVRFYRVSQC